MKRGGPLKRKTPLTSRTQLARTTPAMRATQLTRAAITAKRPKVTPEERAARKGLRERSGGRCEIGGTCTATEAHHRQNRSQGGPWALSNLLHLCSEHHHYVTTHPAAAADKGWAVSGYRHPAAVGAHLAGRGLCFLHDDGRITPSSNRKAA